MKNHLFIKLLFLGLFIFGAFFATYLWIEIPKARNAIYSRGCQDHLSLIYNAMRNYHNKYGRFPPAFIADNNGKPMHSWRILLLETQGQPEWTALYRAYKFDEPWDGPNNGKLAERMPQFYACTSDEHALPGRKGIANYVVIKAPKAIFQADHSISLPPEPAMHDDTILFTETLPGIPWLEPRDLELDRMSLKINDPAQTGIASKDSTGPSVVFMDGRIERLKKLKSISPETLRSMTLLKPADK